MICPLRDVTVIPHGTHGPRIEYMSLDKINLASLSLVDIYIFKQMHYQNIFMDNLMKLTWYVDVGSFFYKHDQRDELGTGVTVKNRIWNCQYLVYLISKISLE